MVGGYGGMVSHKDSKVIRLCLVGVHTTTPLLLLPTNIASEIKKKKKKKKRGGGKRESDRFRILRAVGISSFPALHRLRSHRSSLEEEEIPI
ncbi:hypothetical protein BHE74_00038751 [Ensete ventricosum]|nr:hypothetical protein BHE74_00038751 [Ensete ventricosum]